MEFQPLGNESSPFCRTKWFHMHIKIAFFHISVKVVGGSAVDPGLIPGSLQLRQKSGVGQEIAKLCCLKSMNFFKI